MLRIQMLPAGCGDCLWLEYGTAPATRVVIIDGGVGDTVATLRRRIAAACRERGTESIDVELLVVTHIDNDHILGVLGLLDTASRSLNVKDVWFNGRIQLMRLPTPTPRGFRELATTGMPGPGRPSDLLGSAGGPGDEVTVGGLGGRRETPPSPSDLLGPQQADQLSKLLETHHLPWNAHARWKGDAIVIPDDGDLPTASLEGGFDLTVLGPTSDRLYALCTAWADVLGGTDEGQGTHATGPADLLGRRRRTWPPVWTAREERDSSAANGSSIMLLAEYDGQALLLAGDGHAPDLAAALDRVGRQRNMETTRMPVAAFKLPHHASDKNITRDVLERIDCRRYLVSTDGSVHGHPDSQALLRVLRYSNQRPQLLFNYAGDTTRPWRDNKSDVVRGEFQDYDTAYPADPDDGLILDLAADS